MYWYSRTIKKVICIGTIEQSREGNDMYWYSNKREKVMICICTVEQGREVPVIARYLVFTSAKIYLKTSAVSTIMLVFLSNRNTSKSH